MYALNPWNAYADRAQPQLCNVIDRCCDEQAADPSRWQAVRSGQPEKAVSQ